MAVTPAAGEVLPSPCESCGGEVIAVARAEPATLVHRCAHCGASSSTPFEPAADLRDLLREVLETRRRLRARTSVARPSILLWLPTTADDDDAYRDVAAMVGERLAAGDPSIWLRRAPYPESPDEETIALAPLADLSLLAAPGLKSARRALALLGEVLPPTRAVVLATGVSKKEAAEIEHPKVRVLWTPPDAPGGLFDALAGAFAQIRRVAWWRAIDENAPPGDPLSVHRAQAVQVAAVTDDLCGFLLRLADRGVPLLPDRLIENAGGANVFEPRLRVLREAGALEVVRDRIRLTDRGRALRDRVLPTEGVPTPRRKSTLARLFDEARSGSQEALGRLLKTGGDHARMVARRRLGPALRVKVDSIDISQSVVADLVSGIDRFEFRGDPAWRGYLRRLVENKIRAKADFFGAARRDMKRERSIETRGRSEGARSTEPSQPEPSPADVILRAEEVENLEEALEQMPEGEREVIILRVFEGLSHREIARRLGRPSENAVHKLYGRALARLAGILGRSA